MKTEADNRRKRTSRKAQALPLRCLCDPRHRLVPCAQRELHVRRDCGPWRALLRETRSREFLKPCRTVKISESSAGIVELCSFVAAQSSERICDQVTTHQCWVAVRGGEGLCVCVRVVVGGGG